MKRINKSILTIFIFVVLTIIITACSNNTDNNEIDSSNIDYECALTGNEWQANVSWVNFYHNIEELAKDSDFIGLIEVIGPYKYDMREIGSNGFVLPNTIFLANVIESIQGNEKSIEIYMTGKHGELEVVDDPLLSPGEVWFIFAKQNGDGTYTILSRPNGRFSYSNEHNTITSLYFNYFPDMDTELMPLSNLNLNDVKQTLYN